MALARDWRAQEKAVAKDLGGTRNAGSGAFNRKGDVRALDTLVECKFTGKRSMTLRADVLEKIVNESLAENRMPVLCMDLNQRRYAILEWDDLLELLER